jgi:hypothetical protein
MYPALQQFADVVVVNSERIAHELSLAFRDKTSKQSQRDAFAGNADTGWFYLVRRDDMHTDSVMETVMSPDHGDAITSVYKNHPIFSDKSELLRARDRLIRAISEKVGLSREAIGVDDEGRGRALLLKELSTGQLIDLLAERMGHTVLTTDSHAAAGSLH